MQNRKSQPNKHLRFITILFGFITIIMFNYFSSLKPSKSVDLTPKTKIALSNDIDVTNQIDSILIDKKNYAKQQSFCQNYLKPIENHQWWKNDRKALIKAWLKELSSKNLNEKTIDYIAREAGTGIRFSRKHRKIGSNNKPIATAIFEDNNQHFSKVYWLFRYYFDKGDHEGLVSAFNYGKLPKDLIVQTPHGLTSTISHLILEHQGEHFETIKRLVNAGVIISYDDLVAATKVGLSIENITFLHNKSGLTANKILYQFDVPYSLVTLAVKVAQPELVQYWQSQGSPLNPEWHYQNALDLLASTYQPEHKAVSQQIFVELMEGNVIPNLESTGPRLRTWLPPHLIKQYAHRIDKLNDLSVPKDIYAQVMTEVNYIFYRLLDKQVTDPSTNTPTHPCFSAAGHQLVMSAIGKIMPKMPLVKIATIADKKALAQDRLAQVKTQFSEPDDIIAQLGAQQDIVGKQAIRLFRQQQMMEQIQQAKEQLKSAPPVIEKALEQEITAAVGLFRQGFWDKGFEDLETLHQQAEQQQQEETAQGILDAMLIMELSTQMRIATLTRLLERGANLPVNAITMLVHKGAVDVAKALLDHNLDVHFVDPAGHNALWYSVLSRSEPMLHFLLKQGVSFKPTPYGYDALDQALMQFSFYHEGMGFVAILIRAGAPIELSHKQATLAYQSKDAAIYQALIETYPQLEM